MKCIKNKVTNEIERVNNETAHNRVNSGNWVYCPKHEFKSFVGIPMVDPMREALIEIRKIALQ